MIFAHPHYLYLLLLLIPLIAWYIWKLRTKQASLQVSTMQAFDGAKTATLKILLRHLPFVLRMTAIALIITLLARPQSTN
ncbi:MAG: BatA domain-containing protein, partial [Tannerella sp.]|nr:BatA domain-containing protein [Tannerella sp.]